MTAEEALIELRNNLSKEIEDSYGDGLIEPAYRIGLDEAIDKLNELLERVHANDTPSSQEVSNS